MWSKGARMAACCAVFVGALGCGSTPLGAQDLTQTVSLHSRSYIPVATTPAPAIVAIPGCSGVSWSSPATDEGRPGREGDRLFRRFYPQVSERLRDSGFVVVLVDYLSAEGVLNACSGEVTLRRIADYIDAAIDHAATLPYVDSSRIHVVGWSRGGAGLLEWLGTSAKGEAVTSAAAIYPGCGAAAPWTLDLPVLMLLAGEDDIAPAAECEALALRLPESTAVDVHTYPDARHGFDIAEAPGLVALGGGMSIGHSPEAAEDAWLRLLAFLR